ncbi:hypothetical protein NM688_g8599 [Phlebia brevispora]|uniref:Uncharacterized protein n=1 Tax=Phlebia brevispora TaxID=194682 RepID=A0ACC1RTC2_9APHY|nr:hypothetical protein NM688_g8599 [Phlebia brevispora]
MRPPATSTSPLADTSARAHEPARSPRLGFSTPALSLVIRLPTNRYYGSVLRSLRTVSALVYVRCSPAQQEHEQHQQLVPSITGHADGDIYFYRFYEYSVSPFRGEENHNQTLELNSNPNARNGMTG